MRMKKLALIVLLSTVTLNLIAQNSSKPDTNVGTVTIVHSTEINAAAEKSNGRAFADSVLRVVSIGGKFNVGVSVCSRTKINGKIPPDAIVHDLVTEVYHIIEGSGVLLIGGTLDSAVRIPAKSPIVLKLAGPSSVAKHIAGGTRYDLSPGDIVVIPPNTTHGIIELKTDKLIYTIMRIDPERVLELKN